MSNERAIPTCSQTVGPYFRIGLEHLIERAAAMDAGESTIEIRGSVLDRDGAPVPDAMLEFWSAGIADGSSSPASAGEGHPIGFRRAATDVYGSFAVALARPAPLTMKNGMIQAPHMLVLIFARGLLRHLITRVYFEGEPGNATDPVLNEVPAERRGTLVAHAEDEQPNSYRWNVVLQGNDETVFFAW